MGLGPGDTNRLAQVVLVPLAQAGWLYQTCSIGSRRGQNKPLLVSWHKSYTSIEPFLVPWHKLYTTMELVPVPLVPTCDKKWVYKAVKTSKPLTFFGPVQAVEPKPFSNPKKHSTSFQHLACRDRTICGSLLRHFRRKLSRSTDRQNTYWNRNSGGRQ